MQSLRAKQIKTFLIQLVVAGLVSGTFVWLAFEHDFLTFIFGVIIGCVVTVLFVLYNDFFLDLAEPVIKSKGEIYKYVGDEAIITWRLSRVKGSTRPLDCFFQFKEKISKNAKHYMKTYQVVPTFKAGLHGGKVVGGEMGQVKKEIAFIGDVLNTTSRIEATCNEFGVDLLVSGQMLKTLNLSGKYQSETLGEFTFRGKHCCTEIFSINKI